MAKPFNNEEIGAKQVSIDEYDKSDFKYAFNHFMTPILDDYRRFLDTIAVRDKTIEELENIIRASKLADQTATIERLRGEMKEMKVQESVFVIHAMIDEALDGKE